MFELSGTVSASKKADYPEDLFTSIIDWFKKHMNGATLIVVESKGDGTPHMHYLTRFETSKKYPQTTQWFRRAISDASSYDLSEKLPVTCTHAGAEGGDTEDRSWDKACRYICKGKPGHPPKVLWAYGIDFSDEEIQKFHERSQACQKAFVTKKKAHLPILREACKGLTGIREIACQVIDVYVANDWRVTTHCMESEIRTIHLKNGGDESKRDLLNQMMLRFTYSDLTR